MQHLLSSTTVLALTVLGTLATPSTAAAQGLGEVDARREADRTDVRRYDKLVERLRDLDARYRSAKAAAKDEMRSRNGQISYQTATRVSDLKDEIQLTRSQLVAVAAVANLPVPDLESLRRSESDGDESTSSGSPTVIDHDLRHAKRILLGELAREARMMSSRLRLPLVGRVKSSKDD